MSFPFNPDVYWAGGEKRITLRDAYILMRFFKRLDEIVMREWDRDNDNAIAICRLMGGLEYEIFSEVTTEHALKRREQEELEEVTV